MSYTCLFSASYGLAVVNYMKSVIDTHPNGGEW